jgi:hypothetical protein
MWLVNIIAWLHHLFSAIAAWATLLTTFVFAPMLFIRRARRWSAIGMFYSSYILGLFLWTTCFLYTFDHNGWLWVIFGILFLGLGIIPIAFFGALFHGDWSGVAIILGSVLLIWVTRGVGMHFGEKSDQEARQKNLQHVIAR